jgi:PncC family amidohydrolase
VLPATLIDPAGVVAQRLVARGQTVAVAESSAGGLIAAALLSVPGASAYFRGGVVIYSLTGANELLSGVPGPPPGTRSSSEPWARHLATAIAGKLGADWGIGETGAAGPRGNPYGDPAGHTWLAVHGPDGPAAATNLLTGDDDRAANMERFAGAALSLLADALR